MVSNGPVPAANPVMRALRSMLVVVASIILTLALIEGVLRLFPGLLPEDAQLRLLWNTEELDAGTIADPYLGFGYPANRELTHRTRDFAVKIKTDEHGFRNQSPWPATAEGVIVGDSMAFGYGVDEDKSWGRLLERQLRLDRLVNISLPGLGPQQYFRYFKTLGAPLHPKLLILCVFPGNDVLDGRRFQNWEAAGAQGDFAASQLVQASDLHAAPVTFEPPSALERTHLVLALKAIRNNLSSRFQSETLDFPGGRIQLSPGLYERRMSELEPADPGFRALVESVQNTRKLCAQIGAQLLVVLFPTKEEVYLPTRGAKFADMITPVKQALDPLHLDILDLRNGLRLHANDPQPVYFEVDGHPNTLGNAVIADLVREHIEKNGGPAGIGRAP